MKIITTHLHADFDCLASMVAAKKLYPEADIVFPGSQEKNVRKYLANAEHHISVRRLKSLRLNELGTIIVVDASSRGRIGVFADLTDRADVAFIVFDHHTAGTNDIVGATTHIRNRGACATIMTEILRERKVMLDPQEATLLALGIYEDTGSLTYPSVRPEDFEAAAWLLRQGADLSVVSEYIRHELNPTQVEVLNDLLHSAERRVVRGVTVTVATANAQPQVGDVAELAHKMMEMQPGGALVILVQIADHVHLVARSTAGGVPVGDVARRFGGGGHATAASATIKGEPLPQLVERVWSVIADIVAPAPLASEIMIDQIVTVEPEDSLATVEGLMTRYDIGAVPVVAAEQVVGFISRSVVEKGLHHCMGESRVADLMTREFLTLYPDSEVDLIEDIFVRHRQKQAPVLDRTSGKLLGLVTRGMALGLLYGDQMRATHRLSLKGKARKRPHIRNVSGLMKERIEQPTKKLLNIIKDVADKNGLAAYAVGGFVRDILLRLPTTDIDIVIEGDGISFAQKLAKRLGGRARTHEKFHTAVVTAPGFEKIDVASARMEYYAHPGALPTVEKSAIRNDLYRRDFSINAMAIHLNGAHPGELIDFFGGQADLRDRVLRVLHNLSFVEDPTRAYRAVRFEARYGMILGKQSLALLKAAVAGGLFHRLSSRRLFVELRLALQERRPAPVIERMKELGLLPLIHERLTFDQNARELLGRCEDMLVWMRMTFPQEEVRRWLPPLLLLLEPIGKSGMDQLRERFSGEERLWQEITKILAALDEVNELFQEKAAPPLSAAAQIFDRVSVEGLLYLAARNDSATIREAVSLFLTRWRGTKPMLSGDDLLGMGMGPSSHMATLLREIKAAHIDGTISSRHEALQMAQKRINDMDDLPKR